MLLRSYKNGNGDLSTYLISWYDNDCHLESPTEIKKFRLGCYYDVSDNRSYPALIGKCLIYSFVTNPNTDSNFGHYELIELDIYWRLYATDVQKIKDKKDYQSYQTCLGRYFMEDPTMVVRNFDLRRQNDRKESDERID